MAATLSTCASIDVGPRWVCCGSLETRALTAAFPRFYSAILAMLPHFLFQTLVAPDQLRQITCGSFYNVPCGLGIGPWWLHMLEHPTYICGATS